MKFILHDWRGAHHDLDKQFPEAKREEFRWQEVGGTKKNPTSTEQAEILPCVEIDSLEDLFAFMSRHGNVQIRRPRQNFPYYYLFTDKMYGDFKQR